MIRLLAIALLACAALAGCGDDEPNATPPPETTSSSTAIDHQPPDDATSTVTTPPADGGSGGAEKPADGATSAEDAVRAVLTAEGDPEQACDDFVTAAFIQISYGGRQNCLAARKPGALADSLEIKSSKQTETGQHLVVVPLGGPYDGARIEVEVIDDDGEWRVDSLVAHVPAGP